MLAVLLAAGRGSRMGALTADTPKPLLPLRGRPILDHILQGLAEAGVKEAVIITGYRAERIERHYGNKADGITLSYRRQETPSGTATAVLLAATDVGSQPFLLSWGDILVEPGTYGALRADFEARRPDALLGVNEVDDPWRGAAVYMDDDLRITRLVEKPPRGTSTTRWNNSGVFVLHPIVLDYARRLTASVRGEYELPQALAAMIESGCSVAAHPIRGFWSDLGTPEDLAAAERTYPGA